MDGRTDGRTDRQTWAYWQDKHFQKAFKKFITKFSKLKNLNQKPNTKTQSSDMILVWEGKLKERGCTFSQQDRRHNEVARRTETFITDTEENTTCVKIKS